MAGPYGSGGGLLPMAPGRPGGLLGMGQGFNNPLTQIGLGLLSQGPSLTPINPMQGIGMGLQNYAQLQNMGQRNALAQARLELEQRRMGQADQKRIDDLAAAAEQERVLAEQLRLRGIDPALAQIPGVAEKYLGPPKEVANPMAKFEAYQGMSPEEQAAYQQYVAATRGPGVTVNTGDAPDILGTDATKWRMPDGSTPPPGITEQAAIELGARPITEAQKQTEASREQRSVATRNLEEAEAKWEEAVKVAQADPSGENRRKAEEAAWAVALARQSLLNEGRELSGQTQRALKPPGAIGRTVEQATEGLLDWWRGDQPRQSNVPFQPLGPGSQAPGGTPEPPGVVNWSDL